MALSSRKPWLFSDKSNQPITSHERLELLIKGGFFFEACAVQSAVIEGLLFFSILGEAYFRSPSESAKIRKYLSKFTLGQLITRVKKFELLDPHLLNRLKGYKHKRNFLTHHHLVELHDVDYQSLIAEGEELITPLFEQTREQARKIMEVRGHPEAVEFE